MALELMGGFGPGAWMDWKVSAFQKRRHGKGVGSCQLEVKDGKGAGKEAWEPGEEQRL